MNEALKAAYNTESDPVVPQGYMNDKIYDPSKPLPLLEPAPVMQANIRKSLASWLKRSSGHHPLRLNPMGSRRSSAASSAYTGRSERSYSVSQEDMEKHGADVPPMPAMPALVQQATTEDTSRASQAPPTPPPASKPSFSRDDASAYYKSLWSPTDDSRASRAPSRPASRSPSNRDTATTMGDQHLSVMSGYTATTMYGGERSSVNQGDAAYTAGLTPPPYMMVRPPPVPDTLGAGTGLGINAPGVSVGVVKNAPDTSRISATGSGAGGGAGNVDSLHGSYSRSEVGLPAAQAPGDSGSKSPGVERPAWLKPAGT